MDNNENILISTGMHWKSYVVPAAAITAALGILTVIATGGKGVLQSITGRTDLTGLLMATDIIICLYLLYTGVSVILRNAFTKYEVTETSVCRRSGIISRHVDGYSLFLCENISTDQSVIDRVLNSGRLSLGYNGRTVFRINGISGFRAFSDTLERAAQNARSIACIRNNIRC